MTRYARVNALANRYETHEVVFETQMQSPRGTLHASIAERRRHVRVACSRPGPVPGCSCDVFPGALTSEQRSRWNRMLQSTQAQDVERSCSTRRPDTSRR
jgi:hypothetical protein